MITRRDTKDGIDRLPKMQAERSIYMWEGVERGGTMHYVPLGKNLNPIADVALEDVHTPGSNGSSQPGNFLLVSGALEKPGAASPGPRGFERLVAKAIEAILRDGDATTYQVYQALIARLISSGIMDGGTSVAVDVEGILRDNFWHYESLGGVTAKRWTLDEDRARSQGQFIKAQVSYS